MNLQTFNLNTSLEALISTIENDSEIANWFYYLLSSSSLKSEYGKGSQFWIGLEKVGHRVFLQNISKVVILVFLIIVLFFGRMGNFAAFIPIAFLLFANEKSIRKSIGELSHCVLSRDFEDNDFQNKSLYQISEHYSNKYGVASLVKVQFFIVNFIRMVLVCSIVIFAFGLSLKLFRSYMIIALLFYAATIVTSFHSMFDRMK